SAEIGGTQQAQAQNAEAGSGQPEPAAPRDDGDRRHGDADLEQRRSACQPLMAFFVMRAGGQQAVALLLVFVRILVKPALGPAIFPGVLAEVLAAGTPRRRVQAGDGVEVL